MDLAFIIGCARSGTSILGELLAAHKNVKYIFEAHHVWETAPLHFNGSHRLTDQDVTKEIRTKIRSIFAEYPTKNRHKIIIEKCPRNTLRVPYLKAIFPEAKIIHIVRDGRDVTCSLKPGLSHGWRHLKPPKWRSYTALPIIERCARTWLDSVEIALDDLSKIDHFQIKYEDLISNSQLAVAQLCNFLYLPQCPAMIEFADKIQNSTSQSYHAAYQDRWYRPDHKKRIGRWKENLTEIEKQYVNKILAPVLKRLDYTLFA